MLQAQVGQPPAPVGFLFPVFQIERYYISNICRLASIVDQQGPRDIFYDFGWPEYFFQKYHYGGNYFLPLLGNARKKTFVRYSLTISILLSQCHILHVVAYSLADKRCAAIKLARYILSRVQKSRIAIGAM